MSFARPSSPKDSRASIKTTRGDMKVPKFLELKGTRGSYSQAWMARTDQSTMSTALKRQRLASPTMMGPPRAEGTHTKRPRLGTIHSSRFRIGDQSIGPSIKSAIDDNTAGSAMIADM